MANMSYCRFENTFHDLEDCYDHLDLEDIPKDEQEKQFRYKLIEMCKDIAEQFSNEDECDDEE